MVRRRVIRSTDAPTLSDEEVAALASVGAGLPVLPTDPGGELAMTEAELAILQAKGATVAISDPEGHFDFENQDAEEGEYLFKLGQGENRFEGRLTHVSNNRDTVKLWHASTGLPRGLPRAHLMYYISKGCWLARPPAFDPVLGKLSCPSTWTKCPKKLLTPSDVSDHFRRAHSTENKALQTERAIQRDHRLDQLLDSLTSSSNRDADVQGAQLAAVIMELTETIKSAQATPEPVSAA